MQTSWRFYIIRKREETTDLCIKKRHNLLVKAVELTWFDLSNYYAGDEEQADLNGLLYPERKLTFQRVLLKERKVSHQTEMSIKSCRR